MDIVSLDVSLGVSLGYNLTIMSQQGTNPSTQSVAKQEEASVLISEIQISEVSEDYNPLAPPRCRGLKERVF